MPFDGNGTYNPPAPEYPAIAGDVILASDFNTIIADIAAALSKCITIDGQSGVTANIDFGGNRIVHLAAGVAADDAVNMLQAFTNPTFTATTAQGVKVTGTAFTVSVTQADFTASQVVVLTQAAGDNSTKVASTAFVFKAVYDLDVAISAALGAEVQDRIDADALLAPLASPALTGVPTAPTAAPGTAGTQLATVQYVLNQAFATALPGQTGNDGKFLQTDGTTSFWTTVNSPGNVMFSQTVPDFPDWLPCDGASYVSASYPDLIAALATAPIPVGPALIDSEASGGGSWVAAALSSDGLYAALSCQQTGKGLDVYKRTGSSYAVVASPSGAPTGVNAANSIAWNADASLLAACGPSISTVLVWRRTGDSFAALTVPSGASGFVVCCAFSPDGGYLSVGSASSPYVTTYKIVGDTLTKIANPATLPASQPSKDGQVAWSPDSAFLAVTHAASPFVTIYSRSGDVLTKVANPATLPDSSATGVSFSTDGGYLAVAGTSTNKTIVYSRSGSVFTLFKTGLPSMDYRITYTTDGKLIGTLNTLPSDIRILVQAQDYAEVPQPSAINDNVRKAYASLDGGFIAVTDQSVDFQWFQMGIGQPSFAVPIIANIGSTGEVKGYIKS